MSLLGSFMMSLRGQIAAGMVTPLDQDRPTIWTSRSRKPRAACDELPGRVCRSGYGSLEVGGGRDRVDD